MSQATVPVSAAVLSIIAGVLIAVGSLVSMMWVQAGMGSYGMMDGMMGSYSGMMTGMGLASGMFFGMTILGLASGIIVAVGGVMLYNMKGGEPTMWGALILVFSVLGLFGMGGFFIGTILGIVAGILALTWKPAASQPSPSSPSR